LTAKASTGGGDTSRRALLTAALGFLELRRDPPAVATLR
jgi:hypothetical protein